MVDPEARARFVYLVVRELGATGVRVQDGLAEASDDPCVVRVELGGSRAVEATFDSPPKERADAKRRLLLLARAFEAAIFDSPGTHHGDEPERALNEELGALAGRAGAIDVLVIDARSPIVWGSARGLVGMHHTAEVVRIGRPRRSAAHPEPPTAKRRVERVIARVRALGAIGTLPRGGHLAHLERGRAGGFLARSFAGIYVIIVVFDAPIDELRAERALREHMPAIERLMLALPPRDPDAGAKVVSLRAKRARRG